jgi:hypothetical protein
LGLALVIVTYIPALSTWLPNMLETQAINLNEEPTEGIDDGSPTMDLDALEDDDELDLDALEGGGDEPLDLDSLEDDDEELDLDSLEGDDDYGVLDDD